MTKTWMIPLRLVIDTNIIVSAALKADGIQRTVFLLAMTKPARLYVSDSIIEEYRKVLARPELKIRKGVRQQFLDLIRNRAHNVGLASPLRIAKDPDDDKFLECADASRADFLITGNKRHFPDCWKQTKVVASREFLNIVAPHLFL